MLTFSFDLRRALIRPSFVQVFSSCGDSRNFFRSHCRSLVMSSWTYMLVPLIWFYSRTPIAECYIVRIQPWSLRALRSLSYLTFIRLENSLTPWNLRQFLRLYCLTMFSLFKIWGACVALHAISVFGKVYKIKPWKKKNYFKSIKCLKRVKIHIKWLH